MTSLPQRKAHLKLCLMVSKAVGFVTKLNIKFIGQPSLVIRLPLLSVHFRNQINYIKQINP